MKNLQPLQNAGIQGSSACARALILSFAHINSWGKVTRLVADRNGMVFGTSTLHSKKWSLCSTDIHLKTKVFRCIQTNTLLFFNSMQVYELYMIIYIYMYLSMLYRCFLVAKIAWRLAAWVGDAWWPFDHPFFCSCLDQSDSFKRENMEDWPPLHFRFPKMTSNFFPRKIGHSRSGRTLLVGPQTWSSSLFEWVRLCETSIERL